ncbi:MAG: cupin domain-containing protein [Desulfobacterium sp.]|nr:cupin domain-containing protein [Desulfobacterium sp.]MBU3946721.1 cupin domain-containing protein [Pseudomonadota bacterium]MBU4011252.1 cupin domain-containing protein [Pseudomonadota bacterium]MBU4037613.1 cupin domain-containing protein [Pseudomonadota bacterium]
MTAKKADSILGVGKKIQKIRTEKKVVLDRIANETGFSIDYLKEIEAGKVFPPVGALLQIAKALEIDSGFFLREQESAFKMRSKDYSKRTENYAYTNLTPGAENKHLKAFKVTIEPLQEHKGVGYHHEGEEFVYVLKGKVEVIVGEHTNKLSEGDSLHFNSGIRHMLRNIGKKVAELLVVIYGP